MQTLRQYFHIFHCIIPANKEHTLTILAPFKAVKVMSLDTEIHFILFQHHVRMEMNQMRTIQNVSHARKDSTRMPHIHITQPLVLTMDQVMGLVMISVYFLMPCLIIFFHVNSVQAIIQKLLNWNQLDLRNAWVSWYP